MRYDDPRFQPGAYITDGERLDEVVVTDEAFGAGDRVCVEDCKLLEIKEFPADAISRSFRLLRPGTSRPNRMSIAA